MYCKVKDKIVRSIVVCGLTQFKLPDKHCDGCGWFKNDKVISATKKDKRYKDYIWTKIGKPPFRHIFYVPLYVHEYLKEQANTNDCLPGSIIRKILADTAMENKKITLDPKAKKRNRKKRKPDGVARLKIIRKGKLK